MNHGPVINHINGSGPVMPPSNSFQPLHRVPAHFNPPISHGPVVRPFRGSGPVMPPGNSLQPIHTIPVHGSGPVMPPGNSLQPIHTIPVHGSGPVMPPGNSLQPLHTLPKNLDYGCHFPEPAPFRVYCQPAQFHRVSGQEYGNMTTAYGSSRPLDKYY